MSGGESNSNCFFDPRGYGVIKAKPSELYEKARNMKKKIAIIKDKIPEETPKKGSNEKIKYGYEKINEIFISFRDHFEGIYVFDDVSKYRAKDLLDFYLKIHAEINTTNPSLTKSSISSIGGRGFKLADVLFLEVKSFLSSEMEYSIMMYIYLLRLGFLMSELYVVIDYQTDKFDFIETDIFKRNAPIPNCLISRDEQLVMDRYAPEIYSLSFNIPGTQVHYVVSDSDTIFITELMPIISRYDHKVCSDYAEYKKNEKIAKHDGVVIIKFRSLEEIIELKEIKANYILVDSRVKISTSLLYGGNVPMPKQMSDEYLAEKTKEIRERNLEKICKIMFFVKDNKNVERKVTREIFERSPIIDYIRFQKSGVDLLELYSKHIVENNNSSNYRSILRSEIEILGSLGYETNKKIFDLSLKYEIHPVIVSIINRWFNEKNKNGDPFPRFPILVFVAVATTFDKKIIEVKEHGDRERASNIGEISRFGLEMISYVNKMKEKGECIFIEGGKASERLKNLINFFNIQPNEICNFDVNDFSKFLIYILKTYFSKLLLKIKGYSSYRGSHNQQLNWWITQSSAPEEIFPIIVHSSSNNKHVTLFVPIERI